MFSSRRGRLRPVAGAGACTKPQAALAFVSPRQSKQLFLRNPVQEKPGVRLPQWGASPVVPSWTLRPSPVSKRPTELPCEVSGACGHRRRDFDRSENLMIHWRLAYADRSPTRAIYVESSWSMVGWRKSRNVFFCSLPCSRVGTVADSWLQTLVRQVHTLGGMGIFVRSGLVERVGRANRDIDLTVLWSSTPGLKTRAARGRAASRPRTLARTCERCGGGESWRQTANKRCN